MSAVVKLSNHLSIDELKEICREASHRYAMMAMREGEAIDDMDRDIVHYLRNMPDDITRL